MALFQKSLRRATYRGQKGNEEHEAAFKGDLHIVSGSI